MNPPNSSRTTLAIRSVEEISAMASNHTPVEQKRIALKVMELLYDQIGTSEFSNQIQNEITRRRAELIR